jgi:branched-chain amino acid transport system permease protein
MDKELKFTWSDILKYGAIGGIVAIYIILVGMVVAFNKRYIIAETLTLGQIALFSPVFLLGYFSANNARKIKSLGYAIFVSAMVGLISGAFVAALLVLGTNINLRAVFLNVSPELLDILHLGQETMMGAIVANLLISAIVGLLGGLFALTPRRWSNALLAGIGFVLLMGIMQELMTITFGNKDWYKPIGKFIYAQQGLSWGGMALFLVLGIAYSLWRSSGKFRPAKKVATLPSKQQTSIRIVAFFLGLIILLALPRFLGSYPSEILTTVGIYIIMGLGLNIVVGFAGLLDLGYVAFFAIGAYTVGILTTSGKLATLGWSFWAALPVAVLLAMLAGVLLGIPVLKMRGDYLAIVTLGFGEIIRVLVLSDWLKPYIGGAQGILQIPKPHIGDYVFKGPQQMYYIVLAGIILVGYVAWQLRDARVGRAWKALREDEDVAEAMGIHLVSTKLMAFATGAAFAGLAGGIFAAKLGSIFPQSFNLIVSINVLSLIIVGGIGSLPGVVVGALILVGMPELLREFADYRMLFYGALLVAMMLVKPEGFIPEKTHQRELAEKPDEPEIAPEAPARAEI